MSHETSARFVIPLTPMTERIDTERRLGNSKRSTDRVGGFVIFKYCAVDLRIAMETMTLVATAKASEDTDAVEKPAHVFMRTRGALEMYRHTSTLPVFLPRPSHFHG